MMYLETSQFRNNVAKHIDEVTEVIFNTVYNEIPSSCNNTKEDFQNWVKVINPQQLIPR